MRSIFGMILILALMSFNSFGDSEIISNVGNGACWAESTAEIYKIVSFNENWAYTFNRDTLISSLIENIMAENSFAPSLNIKSMRLTLHCGGYGASFVAHIQTNLGDFCLWSKFKDGKISTRSFGEIPQSLISTTNSDNCDGDVVGELLIGIKSPKILELLQGQDWAKIIKEIKFVVSGTYKINLTKEYLLKSEEVKQLIQDRFSSDQINYVEFNGYNHPIGEYFSLK